MAMSAVFAFLHHLSAFLLGACLFYEAVTFRGDISREDARRLRRVDVAYNVAATTVLVVGVLRVLYFDRGAEFYLHNWLFQTKVALFAVLVLLSFYPTRQFLGWRLPLAEERAPVVPARVRARIQLVLYLELAVAILIVLAAAMMSRGLGTFG